MMFTDWTAKAVEDRILEMADTLRMSPAVKGPQAFGSSMPEALQRHSEAYGSMTARYRETASAGALGRMEQVWAWVSMPCRSSSTGS